ncbi:MAG: glycosyltransferase family 9 protein [Kiritimatiellia bacterium]
MPHPRSVLILRGGALGDFVLTLPVLQSLRRTWPAARLHLAARSSARALAVSCGLADEAHDIESASWAWLFEANPSGFEVPDADLVVSYIHDPDSIVSANLARHYNRAVHLGVSPIIPVAGRRHAVDIFVEPLEKLGIKAPDRVPRLLLPPKDREAVRQLAAAWGGKFAVIQPGSGSPQKNWPLTQFIALARMIEAAGVKVFFLLGEAETNMRAMVSQAWPPERVLDGINLDEVARWLAASAFYAGNDSGITHLAAALGTPVMSLFGPTDPSVWGPRGDGGISIMRAPAGRMAALELEFIWTSVLALITSINHTASPDDRIQNPE